MERSHVYGVELSRLRNLSTELQPPRKIHFRLESDTLPVRDTYLDLYVPEFHQYGSREDRPVRHLDITSTWRGLSVGQAEELKFWEDMFAAVLEYTISNHLIDLIDGMDNCNVDRYPGDLDGRICSFTNNMGGKTFPVNVREIVTCMLELYKRHGNQHQWLTSSGNFYNALCEFLRTRDCFLDTPLHPTVKVTFSASLSGKGEPDVVGILKRFGPFVGFNRLDAFTSEDAWCNIYPSYVESVLDPVYPSFLGRPEYRLASDWIKFEWSSSVEGFRGYVRPIPLVGHEVSTRLNVDLAAVSKRFFPGGVAFERNLRVRVKLSVCRLSGISTASQGESTPPLERCQARRSLFNLPPGLEDLAEVMKANKRAAASSPTKSFGSVRRKETTQKPKKAKQTADRHDHIMSLLEKTRPEALSLPLEVNTTVLNQVDWQHDKLPTEFWGRNVPAWDTIPDRRTQHRQPASHLNQKLWEEKGKTRVQPAEHNQRKRVFRTTPSPRQTVCPEKSLNPFRIKKKQPPGLRPWSTSSERAVHERKTAQPTTEDTGKDSLLASSSKQAFYTRLNTPPPTEFPLPPEHQAKIAQCETSGDEYFIVQPVHTASSPYDLSGSNAPLEMKRIRRPTKKSCHGITHYPGMSWSPQAPATAPPCPRPSVRRRADSILGIHTRKRAASTELFWHSTSDSDTHEEADSFGTWVHRRHDSAVAEQTHERLYEPQGNVDVQAEELRKEMKEWYDAMVLKRDTLRRQTKEERSEEAAFVAAFVGGESGDEGDVDGEVE